VYARGQQFTLNPRHALSNGLAFAMLGRGARTLLAVDSSNYGGNGTLTNMDPPTDWVWNPDLNRYVVDLDGSNDRVVMPLWLGNFDRTQPFSICAYFRSTSITTTENCILGRGLTSGAYTGWNFGMFRRSALKARALNLTLVQNAGTDTKYAEVNSPDSSLAANTIYHGCATYSGSGGAAGILLYIDAVSQTLTTTRDALDGAITQATSALCIGNRGSGGTVSPFPGWITDACIWSRVLSPAEVQLLADRSDPLYRGWIVPTRMSIWFGKSPSTAMPWLYARRPSHIIGSGLGV
jgi:hypothetical protein